jgi:hypothetical protein
MLIETVGNYLLVCSRQIRFTQKLVGVDQRGMEDCEFSIRWMETPM